MNEREWRVIGASTFPNLVSRVVRATRQRFV